MIGFEEWVFNKTAQTGIDVVVPSRFKRTMSIALDPQEKYKNGIIRCITSRKDGIDRSELHKVHGSLNHFTVGERLNIKNESEIIDKLIDKDCYFIGLEDPDIWIDEKADLTHLYFTIPIKPHNETKRTKIHLGHAVGKNINSLEMTMPVLMNVAKEVCIVPKNTKGIRYNLIESRDKTDAYSTVRVAIAKEMGKSWKYGETVFHPNDYSISWIAAHASPGPLFPKSFMDVGTGKSLGIMNGRATGAKGIFSIGLFIYDYEHGKIDWVSSSPLIRDGEAKTITFASQFVETGKGEGILYAHVDDSFVRSYIIKAKDLYKIIK